MNFPIVSDTAGAHAGELASELRDILEDKINTKYSNTSTNIGIAIRCLPDSYNRIFLPAIRIKTII
ncbi:hypothetical protein SAMN05444362_102422 [Dysgonomonas macrotermitis]|uniref:Uncharacterized protein n=1 Tax=Dysgonomonas macrotermitis TaxID=1346286 RepID=A0A1M4X787_9BACT|nr:hypothetical protein SAMN05444362_102422 [Dysgonomonas macrotermitis]